MGPSSWSKDQTWVHAMETQGVLYSQEILCATISRKDHRNSFFGNQKVFCFWNSCHIRQPLLEIPMLLQSWLYARTSNRNAMENCRLVSCCFISMHQHTSHAHRRLLYGKMTSESLTIHPTVQIWLPVTTFSSETLKNSCVGNDFPMTMQSRKL